MVDIDTQRNKVLEELSKSKNDMGDSTADTEKAFEKLSKKINESNAILQMWVIYSKQAKDSGKKFSKEMVDEFLRLSKSTDKFKKHWKSMGDTKTLKESIKVLTSVKYVYESLMEVAEKTRKSLSSVVPSKTIKDTKVLLHNQELLAKIIKKNPELVKKYSKELEKAMSSKDALELGNLSLKMRKDVTAGGDDSYEMFMSATAVEKGMKSGRDEIMEYKKALGSIPYAGAAAGSYMLVKAVNNLSDKFLDSSIKYKQLKRDMAVGLGTSREGFPATIKQLTQIGKELNLTREETAKFGSVLRESSAYGLEFEKVNQIASDLKDSMGELDVEELKKAVDMIKTLPDTQIEFALNGKGNFDDEAGMLLNLMKQGKLSEYIELKAKGLGGEEALSEAGFTAADKAMIESQKNIQMRLDDFKKSMLDMLGGAGTPWVATVASGITTIVGSVGTIAFTVGAIKALMAKQAIEGSAGKIAGGVSGFAKTPVSKLGAGGTMGAVGLGLGVAAGGFELGGMLDEWMGISDSIINSVEPQIKQSEKYVKTREKERKIIEQRNKKQIDGLKTLETLNNELKRAEGLATLGMEIKATMSDQIKILRTMGGETQEYQNAIEKSLKGTTQAYKAEVDAIRKIRQKAVEDETMSAAERSVVLMKATMQEAKATETFVNGLMDTVGKYKEIPEVIVNTLKSSLESIKSSWQTASGIFGDSSEFISSKTKILSNSLDSLSISLNQFGIESLQTTDTMKKLSDGASNFNPKVFDELQNKIKEQGVDIQKVDTSGSGRSDAKDIVEKNVKNIDAKIKELGSEKAKLESQKNVTNDSKRLENAIDEIKKIQEGIGQKQIGQVIKQNISWDKEELKSNLSKREYTREELSKQTDKDTGKGIDTRVKELQDVQNRIKISINKFQEAGFDVSELNESLKKFKETGDVKYLEELSDKYNDSMSKAKVSGEIIEQQISENEKISGQLELLKTRYEEQGKTISNSVVGTQLTEKMMSGLNESIVEVVNGFSAIVNDLSNAPTIQALKAIEENVEAGKAYELMFGKGAKYYEESARAQGAMMRATENAIEEARKRLNEQEPKILKFTDDLNNLMENVKNIKIGDEGLQKTTDEFFKASEEVDKINKLKEKAFAENDATSVEKYNNALKSENEKKKKLFESIEEKYNEIIKNLSDSESNKKYLELAEKEDKMKSGISSKETTLRGEQDETKRKDLIKEIKDEKDALEKLIKEKDSAVELMGEEEKNIIKKYNGMKKINVLDTARNVVMGQYADTLKDFGTKEKQVGEQLVDMINKFQSRVQDIVSNDIVMKKLAIDTEATTTALELAGQSLNPQQIKEASEEHIKAVYQENAKKFEMIKTENDKMIADAKKELEMSKGQTNEKEKQVVLDLLVTKAKQDTLQSELDLKNKVLEAAKIENEMASKRLNIQEQAVQIEKDIMQDIGGPFETIFALEVETVNIARSRVALAQTELETLQKYGGSAEAIQEAQLKLRKAEGEVIRKQMGAQRSAMEKMLGGMLSSFQQVGAFKGPSRAAKFGSGFMAEGDPESGFIWQGGEEASKQAKEKGITGYGSRVSKTNLGGGERMRGTGAEAKRFGGAGVESFVGASQSLGMGGRGANKKVEMTEKLNTTGERLVKVLEGINGVTQSVTSALFENTKATEKDSAVTEKNTTETKENNVAQDEVKKEAKSLGSGRKSGGGLGGFSGFGAKSDLSLGGDWTKGGGTKAVTKQELKAKHVQAQKNADTKLAKAREAAENTPFAKAMRKKGIKSVAQGGIIGTGDSFGQSVAKKSIIAKATAEANKDVEIKPSVSTVANASPIKTKEPDKVSKDVGKSMDELMEGKKSVAQKMSIDINIKFDNQMFKGEVENVVLNNGMPDKIVVKAVNKPQVS